MTARRLVVISFVGSVVGAGVGNWTLAGVPDITQLPKVPRSQGPMSGRITPAQKDTADRRPDVPAAVTLLNCRESNVGV